MVAKIDCVAVTDHNRGVWIDKRKDAYAHMKERANAGSPQKGFRELTIFPGVENLGQRKIATQLPNKLPEEDVALVYRQEIEEIDNAEAATEDDSTAEALFCRGN
jgi:hypothetical protein